MPTLALEELRRLLHRNAERSGQERRTSELIAGELLQTGPDELLRGLGLGGHGVAAVYQGAKPGPTVLLRSDMDALPIAEGTALAHSSEDPGTSHKCGHDGHMTLQVAVARSLAQQRPARGRAVLLFQPAEETGEGAESILADPRYEEIAPQVALALHNLPGYPLGQIVLREGTFASASQGLIVELEGVSSHAAEPHRGVSPVAAAAAIAQGIQAAPQQATALHKSVQATVVGMEVGGPAFGTSPGHGRVMATLRAHTEDGMRRVSDHCVALSQGLAQAHGLQCRVSFTEVFPPTINDSRVVEILDRAGRDLGMDVAWASEPFAWSEDFGHFGLRGPAALFGLGAGLEQQPLHHPHYDFPDPLIETGSRYLIRCLAELLARSDFEQAG